MYLNEGWISPSDATLSHNEPWALGFAYRDDPEPDSSVTSDNRVEKGA